jgi:hypothetical protein
MQSEQLLHAQSRRARGFIDDYTAGYPEQRRRDAGTNADFLATRGLQLNLRKRPVHAQLRLLDLAGAVGQASLQIFSTIWRWPAAYRSTCRSAALSLRSGGWFRVIATAGPR